MHIKVAKEKLLALELLVAEFSKNSCYSVTNLAMHTTTCFPLQQTDISINFDL